MQKTMTKKTNYLHHWQKTEKKIDIKSQHSHKTEQKKIHSKKNTVQTQINCKLKKQIVLCVVFEEKYLNFKH
jgi:hypothetical protein